MFDKYYLQCTMYIVLRSYDSGGVVPCCVFGTPLTFASSLTSYMLSLELTNWFPWQSTTHAFQE